MEQSKKEIFQWHPAFYAGLQVELKEDAQNLIFENEHQLGTRPKEIDVLVIKRQKELPVHKNIGRIFRKYNIIEYKSPVDYLGIDDFYKVYGYLCFFKADTQEEDGISVEELTLSLMCTHYPRKLIEHLRKVRGYGIQRVIERREFVAEMFDKPVGKKGNCGKIVGSIRRAYERRFVSFCNGYDCKSK